ncbi:unnamed protein product [Durusdinium trenchii]|uniref:Uncharacterized protein n=1 Tax=Durusdinium trenchii TaxID=1381693 RepID=A0ABP0SYW1_9DINO
MMRGILVALLCGWALADVPERDESCEPLEDPSVLMQLGTKNGFVAWMKSLSGDVTATCDFDGANPFGIQFIDPLYYCFGNPPTCFCALAWRSRCSFLYFRMRFRVEVAATRKMIQTATWPPPPQPPKCAISTAARPRADWSC